MGLPQNSDEAFKWYSKALNWYKTSAEAGHPSPQGSLGICYLFGLGTIIDYDKSIEWLKKAAEKNDAKAQFYLGFCYENGNGVIKNNEEALKWYKKAAEQKFPLAECKLSKIM